MQRQYIRQDKYIDLPMDCSCVKTVVTFASHRPAHSLLMFIEIHQAEQSTDECLEPGQCHAVFKFTLLVQPIPLFWNLLARWTLGGPLGGQRPPNLCMK